MDSKTNDIQAFPTPNSDFDNNWNKESHKIGMTLRDYFAAKSISSVTADFWNFKRTDMEYEKVAEVAYKIADAMLKERLK